MDPAADFIANRTVIYEGQSVQFTNYSTKATSSNWSFGDNTSSILSNPSKTYSTPGVYTVSLSINNGASTKTETSYIKVIPYRGVPYTPAMGGDFETNPIDFAAMVVSGTAFQRANSTVTGKNGTRIGNFAWVTGLTGNYAENTTSYLYTPNFNFTASGTYTLRFYCRNAFETGYDGFIVEYSLDKGSTWLPLGTTTATSWYDFAKTSGIRSFPLGQAFFNAANSSYTLKTRFTGLQNNPRVGFRFVFKSDVSVNSAGLAIDDFEITGPSNVALPVNLISFIGKRTSNSEVKLNWQTANEINFSHYDIERKLNWNDSFPTVGNISASQNVEAAKMQYNHLDPNNNTSISYYRLKMVDKDGKFAYSNTIIVKGNTSKPENYAMLVPVSNQAKTMRLISELSDLHPANIKIITVGGSIVASGILNYNETISLESLPNGIYFARFKFDDCTEYTQKILMQ